MVREITLRDRKTEDNTIKDKGKCNGIPSVIIVSYILDLKT